MKMKGRVISILLAIFLAFTSCHRTEDGELVPPISVDEMGMVLLELQYAEQKSIGKFSDSLSLATKKLDRNFDSLSYYYQEVLDRHDMNFKEFVEYLDWYKENAHFLDQALAHAKEVLEENIILPSEDKDTLLPQELLLDEDLKQDIMHEHMRHQGIKTLPVPDEFNDTE